jgi:hypothetical protein
MSDVEQTIEMRRLEDSAYPPGPRVRFLHSALRLAYSLGFVRADPDPLPPEDPPKCGVPIGVGARTGRVEDAPPKIVRWR